MKKLFIIFFTIFSVQSEKLPSNRGVIYHSISDEKLKITLSNHNECTSVVSCGEYQSLMVYYGGELTKVPVSLNGQPFYIDSIRLGAGDKNSPNQRVLFFNTNGKDVYGWSDGDVEYKIEKQ